MLEETGWEPGPLTLLCAYGADVGISDARFHRDQADGATMKGPPADTTEATPVAWMPLSAVRDLLDRGQLDDGASITALLYSSRSRQSAPRSSRANRCRKPEQVREGFLTAGRPGRL